MAVRWRRVLGILVLCVVVIGATVAVLSAFFGLRFVMSGSGMPFPTFVKSAEEQAAEVARNRAEQRAAATVPASAAAPTAIASSTPDATAAAAPALAPYWTGFRGPSRDGHYREQPILTTWPAGGLKPLWKQPSGGGYASFVVARGRAFTIEQRGGNEVVAAYDVTTGRELWTAQWPAAFRESMGGDGPRATPAWHDGVVYALGAEGELRALDEANGTTRWRKNILEESGAVNLQWGMSASPLVVDDTIIVQPGGRQGRSIMAFHRLTGALVWAVENESQAYVSPMLMTLAGVRQIVLMSATRVVGLTPDRGELLWEHPWVTEYGINSAQPLMVAPNRLMISSGYGVGAAVIELAPNVARFSVREIWRNNRMKNKFTSSVFLDGFIYGLDESILACVDAATGELKWKGGRYGYGQIVLASGHIIVLTEDGELVLVRATPERHHELARSAAIEGKTWNHPALSGGILFVRNLQEMAAFDLRVR
jgi:outer membrane protein assembly factor BamB